ncbi:copper amine oxidase N-terminal domain-containing protein [Paenibacillus thalictri]|uniref:Copper amine oxidase N-terminal domain-containing protein n=1 Tax=Paenibacillus thalictri TaxID=2527873 RepID=A0A4Q9DMX8_9BACL|nr:copper amine oxidase N-terminal domain-containing protein [Paenibacillus thalictri]TBL77288.1 copper amine oxidase N-terminal domain-containing protein [Paenibacillus thalictri]
MNNTMKKSLAAAALSALMTTGAAYAAPEQAHAISATAPASAAPVSIQIGGETLADTGFQTDNPAEPMLPLRAVSETLGYTLVWNQDTLSGDLAKDRVMTTVKTGEDSYAVNKMLTPLGKAPELIQNKLYVPASFVSKILHGTVNTEGNAVVITSGEQRKSAKTSGVITAIRQSDTSSAVQIRGAGMDGIVLTIGKDTLIQAVDGTKLSLSELQLGMSVTAEHSLAATLSLPPQTPTYQITVSDNKRQGDVFGTAGEVEEVRTGDDGTVSLRIKGTGLNESSQSEIVLRITGETSIVDQDGQAVEKSALVQGGKVIGFYNGMLTRSLPPIGGALKVVVAPAQK